MAKLEPKDFVTRLILTLVVGLGPSLAPAQDYSHRLPNMETDRAYQRLLHATIFNLGGVGYGATITSEEKAFRVLVNSPNSTSQFQRLLNEGNPEGQLYALYGLYREDAQLLKNAVERLGSVGFPPARWQGLIFIEKRKVRFADGCVFYGPDMNVIIERMARGEFDDAYKESSAKLMLRWITKG